MTTMNEQKTNGPCGETVCPTAVSRVKNYSQPSSQHGREVTEVQRI